MVSCSKYFNWEWVMGGMEVGIKILSQVCSIPKPSPLGESQSWRTCGEAWISSKDHRGCWFMLWPLFQNWGSQSKSETSLWLRSAGKVWITPCFPLCPSHALAALPGTAGPGEGHQGNSFQSSSLLCAGTRQKPLQTSLLLGTQKGLNKPSLCFRE